jgi:hypothetical protein
MSATVRASNKCFKRKSNFCNPAGQETVSKFWGEAVFRLLPFPLISQRRTAMLHSYADQPFRS